MRETSLSSVELDLLNRLPGPPPMASTRVTNVWIVEWLNPQDQSTGRLLYDWLQGRRPGWATYVHCNSKNDVLAAIERAAVFAQRPNNVPLLHLEAHGNKIGLAGPDGRGGSAQLTWEELADPLQRLNLATRCNLVVFMGACVGFAGIKTFYRGPRAPAVALVGPTGEIVEGDLLRSTKEFYRCLIDGDSSLADIVASASRETTRSVEFEVEPFALLAFDAMARALIVSIRPEERERKANAWRQIMRDSCEFSDSEIEHRLTLLPAIRPSADLQAEWDKLFMIDLWQENRENFGVNMTLIHEALVAHEQSIRLQEP